MEVYEAIEKRRTIRRFTAPPTKDQLSRILKAGSLAPSPFNRQGWDVVVVEDLALLQKIGEIKRRLTLELGPPLSGAVEDMARRQQEAFTNTVLLVIYQRIGKNPREIRFDGGGAWLLMENICLAAVAEGLGTRIVSFWDWAEEEVNRLLLVPEDKKQVSAINIGIPDVREDIRPRSLKVIEQWVHWNHF